MKVRTGLGQDSHQYLDKESSKPLIVGGLIFEDYPGFDANSDGDVVLHAICNALSSLSHVLILGGIADELCLKQDITDSEVYLEEAMKTLGDWKISNVAVSIEALKPPLKARFPEMRQNIARIMGIAPEGVGITATTGEGLTDVGCGDGMQATALVTVYQ